MEAIFRWLAKVLAGILENYADPNLQAKLDAYNAKVAEQELARARFMEQIRTGERELMALSQTLTDNQKKADGLKQQNEQAEADLKKRIADRARLSDMAKLELDV